MRHQKAGRKLGRNASHRLALKRNLTRSLIESALVDPATTHEIGPMRLYFAGRACAYMREGGPMVEQQKFEHLSAAEVSRLPADLDLSAVDDLLAAAAPEVRALILAVLQDSLPLPESGTLHSDWAHGRMLGSTDPILQSIIERVYAQRKKVVGDSG